MFMCSLLSEIIFFESIKSPPGTFFSIIIYVPAPRKVSVLKASYLTKFRLLQSDYLHLDTIRFVYRSFNNFVTTIQWYNIAACKQIILLLLLNKIFDIYRQNY